MMPLPPPGPGDLVYWALLLIVAVLIVGGFFWVLRYLLMPLKPEASQSSVDDVMRDLLKEIRLLRRDIEELREELRE